MAAGSASELEYQLLLGHDLGLLGASDYERLSSDVTEIKRMLSAFIQTLHTNQRPKTDKQKLITDN
jgi:four helix bundle protein